MLKEAEANAEEDRKRRELIEKKNMADSMAHQTEKTLKEHGDKLDAADREALSRAIEKVKTAARGEDGAAIDAATEEMTQASYRLSEILYKNAGPAAGEEAGAGPNAAPPPPSGKSGAADEEVIDADFEVKG
jgi:molecular chaperone DnaK